MELIVNKRPNEIKNGYYLFIHTMSGDCDGYDDIELGEFTQADMPLLEEIINLCDKMLKMDADAYENLGDFQDWLWYGSDNEDEDESEKLIRIGELSKVWPSDEIRGLNSIVSYKVIFYDKNVAYDVEIKR